MADATTVAQTTTTPDPRIAALEARDARQDRGLTNLWICVRCRREVHAGAGHVDARLDRSCGRWATARARVGEALAALYAAAWSLEQAAEIRRAELIRRQVEG